MQRVYVYSRMNPNLSLQLHCCLSILILLLVPLIHSGTPIVATTTSDSGDDGLTLIRTLMQDEVNSRVTSIFSSRNVSGTLPPLSDFNIALARTLGSAALQFQQLQDCQTIAQNTSNNDGNGCQNTIRISNLPWNDVKYQRNPRQSSNRTSIDSSGITSFSLPSTLLTPSQLSNLFLPTIPFQASSIIQLSTTLSTTSDRLTPELVEAYRSVRFGMYDSLYGYLEFVGYQLSTVGFFIVADATLLNGHSVSELFLANELIAIGNQFLALGYLFEGIKGSEEIEAASIALSNLLSKPPTIATANANSSSNIGTVLSSGQSTPSVTAAATVMNGTLNGANTEGTDGASQIPLFGFETQNAKSVATTVALAANSKLASNNQTNQLVILSVSQPVSFSFPNFLFTSWVRLETSSAPSEESYTKKNAVHRVLLQFSRNSYERLESHRFESSCRIKQQRCVGAIEVDSEWEIPDHSDSAIDPEGPLSDAFSLPLGVTANLTISISGCSNRLSKSLGELLVLRFLFLQMQYNGSLHSVIVEADGEKKAFIRL